MSNTSEGKTKLSEEQKRRDAFTARRMMSASHVPVADSPSSSVEHERRARPSKRARVASEAGSSHSTVMQDVATQGLPRTDPTSETSMRDSSKRQADVDIEELEQNANDVSNETDIGWWRQDGCRIAGRASIRSVRCQRRRNKKLSSRDAIEDRDQIERKFDHECRIRVPSDRHLLWVLQIRGQESCGLQSVFRETICSGHFSTALKSIQASTTQYQEQRYVRQRSHTESTGTSWVHLQTHHDPAQKQTVFCPRTPWRRRFMARSVCSRGSVCHASHGNKVWSMSVRVVESSQHWTEETPRNTQQFHKYDARHWRGIWWQTAPRRTWTRSILRKVNHAMHKPVLLGCTRTLCQPSNCRGSGTSVESNCWQPLRQRVRCQQDVQTYQRRRWWTGFWRPGTMPVEKILTQPLSWRPDERKLRTTKRWVRSRRFRYHSALPGQGANRSEYGGETSTREIGTTSMFAADWWQRSSTTKVWWLVCWDTTCGRNEGDNLNGSIRGHSQNTDDCGRESCVHVRKMQEWNVRWTVPRGIWRGWWREVLLEAGKGHVRYEKRRAGLAARDKTENVIDWIPAGKVEPVPILQPFLRSCMSGARWRFPGCRWRLSIETVQGTLGKGMEDKTHTHRWSWTPRKTHASPEQNRSNSSATRNHHRTRPKTRRDPDQRPAWWFRQTRDNTNDQRQYQGISGINHRRCLRESMEREDQRRRQQKIDYDELDEAQITRYRALVARANYLAVDRGDIAFCVKELARCMSSPSRQDWERLRRLARYLRHKPRCVLWYAYQGTTNEVTCFTDSDWAGCKKTRRFTSGGCMLWRSHPIKMWSRTQALVSLSSAETELYAAIKACSETLGFLSLLKDYQVHANGKVMSDASAALGIIKRQGLGRTRHIHTSYLWIQHVNERGINFSKVPGSENCADLFTKPLTRESAEHLSELVGMEFPEGHDEIAFTINFISQSRRRISPSIQSSLQDLGLSGTYFVWSRMDLKSKCFRTSVKGGPSWKDVEARVTLDASTGNVIKIEAARNITRECEHQLLPGGPCDIVTLLIWSNPTIESGLRLRI